ncbi:MAG: hypothetical protein AB7P40_04425 [Chloroflexota bacterium]
MSQQSPLIRRSLWISMTAGLALLVTTGCALLDSATGSQSTPSKSGDGSGAYLVVTVGGSPAVTATLTVAETIPDSTPLPRIVLPTRDPSTPARPVASPSISRGGSTAAARASRPVDSAVPVGSPVAATP